MGKAVKKIWNIVTSIIVALAVLLAIALVGVRLIGFQVFTVLSGSMEPTYHVAVSYTHLDVYKRQTLCRLALTEALRCRSLWRTSGVITF